MEPLKAFPNGLHPIVDAAPVYPAARLAAVAQTREMMTAFRRTPRFPARTRQVISRPNGIVPLHGIKKQSL